MLDATRHCVLSPDALYCCLWDQIFTSKYNIYEEEILRKDIMGYNCSPERLRLDLEELFHYTVDEGKKYITVTSCEKQRETWKSCRGGMMGGEGRGFKHSGWNVELGKTCIDHGEGSCTGNQLSGLDVHLVQCVSSRQFSL